MGQTTIFNFIGQDGGADAFEVVVELPEFLDVDLSVRGPYRKGDVIKRGDVTDRMLEILVERGWIVPKKDG